MRPRRLVLLVVAVLVAAISVWAVANHRREHPPFDRAKWAAADLATRTRAGMVDDLIRRRHLIGMTRAEVTALLGPSIDPEQFDGWDLVYPIGPDDGYGIDPEWLVLRLGPDGRIARHKVIRG